MVSFRADTHLYLHGPDDCSRNQLDCRMVSEPMVVEQDMGDIDRGCVPGVRMVRNIRTIMGKDIDVLGQSGTREKRRGPPNTSSGSKARFKVRDLRQVPVKPIQGMFDGVKITQ